MIELNRNELVFRRPDVHPDAVCHISFQRTLRIPDDNRRYPLPAGLGRFPLAHVKHHATRLPEAWKEHGGVLLPMYQAEAMWIDLSRNGSRSSAYPFAIKIAAGKVNAVSGKAWKEPLKDNPQDYVTIPEQRWLDGFCVQRGLIRQFVAMPLGKGYTAEEQLTGTAQHGGLQIVAYPMKREFYLAMRKAERQVRRERTITVDAQMGMGLAPGGLMRQSVAMDLHGADAWDQSQPSRVFVHILNSEQWQDITGQSAPGSPPSAADYARAGLPWFDYYDDRITALEGAKKLARLDSVAALGIKLGQHPLPDNEPITPVHTVPLGPSVEVIENGHW